MQAKQLKSDPSLAFDTQCICHYQTCLRVEPGDIHPFYSLELLLLRQNGSNEYQSTRSLNFRWTCNYERKKKKEEGTLYFWLTFFIPFCLCVFVCLYAFLFIHPPYPSYLHLIAFYFYTFILYKMVYAFN